MAPTGLQYLQQVLSKPINEIFNEKKNCELDPSRYETSKRNTVDFTGTRKNLIRTGSPDPGRSGWNNS